jgi:hypothetical protein
VAMYRMEALERWEANYSLQAPRPYNAFMNMAMDMNIDVKREVWYGVGRG